MSGDRQHELGRDDVLRIAVRVGQRSRSELADAWTTREVLKLLRSLTQKAAHPLAVAAAVVLVAHRDLDQAVQELAARPGRSAPHLLPLVVALVEVALVAQS